jgi:hypothetical protein
MRKVKSTLVLIVTLPHNGSLDMVIDRTCDNDGAENHFEQVLWLRCWQSDPWY